MEGLSKFSMSEDKPKIPTTSAPLFNRIIDSLSYAD